MNKNIFIGTITKDVQLKKSKQGKSYTSFCLRVKRNYKNHEGKYDADFPFFVLWGKAAEILEKYSKKGDKIAVEAEYRTNIKQLPNGGKEYEKFFLCKSIEILTYTTQKSGDEREIQEPIETTIEQIEEGYDFDISEEEIQF